jgi:Tfp pilus assembly protein PilF
VSDARSAVRLQPWASSPYLQLALVSEASGNLPAARAAIGRAIHRDPSSWSVWLVAARIATKQGDLAAARRGLARAKSLNPRSPLFAGGRD